MTVDPHPNPDGLVADEPAVRLVVLGDAKAAPVCDGDVCYLPAAPDAPTPRREPEAGERPQ